MSNENDTDTLPAPATAPWFMPRLKPCGALALRIARMACWVRSAIAAASSGASSV